jgi:hypothetical protein
VLLVSDSVAGQTTFLKDLPPGKYSDLVVRFSGVSAAAQTLAIADLGRLRITEVGRDLVNVDCDNLRFINMVKGGSSRIQAGAAAASAVTLRIPRGYGDNNVHQVIESDVVQVQMTFGANFTTKFTNAQKAILKVYGLVRETGEMAYNLLIQQIEQSYGGAGTFYLPLRQENVIAVYVVNGTAGDLDNVRVIKDGVEIANVQQGGTGVEDNDMVSISDLMNTTDAPDAVTAFVAATGANADSSVSEIALADAGEIGEFLSDDVQIEYRVSPAAAYVQECVVFSADFTPTRLRQTKIETAAVVGRKIARKNSLGRGRPIQTLKIAAE